MDQRADAVYYVLFRLAQMGYEAEPTSHVRADVVACSPEGTRVALLRVHARGPDGFGMRANDGAGDARNRAHVFVDVSSLGTDAVCFVVPAAVVAAELRSNRGWPGAVLAALDPYREAWHVLGLSRRSSSRSAPVVSPSSPSA